MEDESTYQGPAFFFDLMHLKAIVEGACAVFRETVKAYKGKYTERMREEELQWVRQTILYPMMFPFVPLEDDLTTNYLSPIYLKALQHLRHPVDVGPPTFLSTKIPQCTYPILLRWLRLRGADRHGYAPSFFGACAEVQLFDTVNGHTEAIKLLDPFSMLTRIPPPTALDRYTHEDRLESTMSTPYFLDGAKVTEDEIRDTVETRWPMDVLFRDLVWIAFPFRSKEHAEQCKLLTVSPFWLDTKDRTRIFELLEMTTDYREVPGLLEREAEKLGFPLAQDDKWKVHVRQFLQGCQALCERSAKCPPQHELMAMVLSPMYVESIIASLLSTLTTRHNCPSFPRISLCVRVKRTIQGKDEITKQREQYCQSLIVQEGLEPFCLSPTEVQHALLHRTHATYKAVHPPFLLSLLYQANYSLQCAFAAYGFQHRDLHLGNFMVNLRLADPAGYFSFVSSRAAPFAETYREILVPSYGSQAVIVDFNSSCVHMSALLGNGKEETEGGLRIFESCMYRNLMQFPSLKCEGTHMDTTLMFFHLYLVFRDMDLYAMSPEERSCHWAYSLSYGETEKEAEDAWALLVYLTHVLFAHTTLERTMDRVLDHQTEETADHGGRDTDGEPGAAPASRKKGELHLKFNEEIFMEVAGFQFPRQAWKEYHTGSEEMDQLVHTFIDTYVPLEGSVSSTHVRLDAYLVVQLLNAYFNKRAPEYVRTEHKINFHGL